MTVKSEIQIEVVQLEYVSPPSTDRLLNSLKPLRKKCTWYDINMALL